MKILITGSTSQQANPVAHRRAVNFTGLVWEAMRGEEATEDNEVFWEDPDVRWTAEDLRRFDRIVVGIAPPMAMGANRAYGALSVINELWGDRRLTLLMDTPDPAVLTRGLRSVEANWPSFTKDFFSYRKQWALAREQSVNTRLRAGVQKMLRSPKWPRTIVPGLPWSNPTWVSNLLPPGAAGRVQTVSLDSLVIDRFGGRPEAMRSQEWALEKTAASPDWLEQQGLAWPVRDLPHNFRKEVNEDALQQLERSAGLLVGPVRKDVWWTPRIAMALATHTPVFTDWHTSRRLGPSWTELPRTFETYTPEEAARIAEGQYKTFRRAIPGVAESVDRLYAATGPGRTRAKTEKRTA